MSGKMTAHQLRTDPEARRRVERMVRKRGPAWTARHLQVSPSTVQNWRYMNLVDVTKAEIAQARRKRITDSASGFEFPARLRQKVEPLSNTVGPDSWPPLFELDESYWHAFDGRNRA